MKLRTILIDEELWDLLKEMAALTNKNKNQIIREAISEKIADIQKNLFIENKVEEDKRNL